MVTSIDAELRAASPEAEPPRRRRRRKRTSSSSSRRVGGRVRFVYFSLASLWGCLAGTGAVVIALRSREAMPSLDGKTMLSLLAALAVSIIGAAIVAAAYYSASRRLG